MTDYWKSNARKYCDFCKCWISDNKASVAFHENGKRHQANVAKRVTDISIQSEKEERNRKKMELDIRKMEEAALRSYAQDIHAGRDLTARNISTVLESPTTSVTPQTRSDFKQEQSEESGLSTTPQLRRQIDPLRLVGVDDCSDEKFGYYRPGPSKDAAEQEPNASLWVEAKTEDNYTYYWNIKTNESVWEKPKEGYLSWKEFQKINDIAIRQQEIQQAEEAKEFQKNAPEMVARYNREKLKLLRPIKKSETSSNMAEVKEEITAQSNFMTEEEAAAPVIGQWQIVEEKPATIPPPLDLGLPKVKTPPRYVPVFTPAESTEESCKPKYIFKEKIIDKLDPGSDDDTAPTTFKRRKISSKRSARQILADD